MFTFIYEYYYTDRLILTKQNSHIRIIHIIYKSYSRIHLSPFIVNVMGGFPEIAHPEYAKVLPFVMIHALLLPRM